MINPPMNSRLGLTLICICAAGGGVALGSIATDEPPPQRSGDDPARPGSTSVGARAADPDGGPDWAARIHETESGRLCVEAGRSEGARFGPADENGEVIEQPALGHGSCNEDSTTDQAAVLRLGRSGQQGARTVVYGRVTGRGSRVVLSRGGSEQVVDVADDGTFVVPLRGRVAPTELPLEIEHADGTRARFDWR
jgi:hypothetical protein